MLLCFQPQISHLQKYIVLVDIKLKGFKRSKIVFYRSVQVDLTTNSYVEENKIIYP